MTEGGTRPKPAGELKSAWGKHVRAHQEEHGVTYKVALQQAKATYKPATKAKAAPKPRAAPKPKAEKKPKVVKAPKQKTEKKIDGLAAWRKHVSEHRESNPQQSLKEALQEAKMTYRKEPTPKPKPELKRDVESDDEYSDYDVAYSDHEHQSGSGRAEPIPDGRSVESEVKMPVEKPAIVLTDVLEPKAEPTAEVKRDVTVTVRTPKRGTSGCEYGCHRRRCSCAHATYYE